MRQGKLYRSIDEHVERLYRNMRVLRLNIPLTKQEFANAIVDVVRQNALKEDVYIRPIVYWGAGTVGLYPYGRANDYAIYVDRWASTSTTSDAGSRSDCKLVGRISDNSFLRRQVRRAAYVNNVLAKVEAVQTDTMRPYC